MIGIYNDGPEGDHLDQALLDSMLSDDDADDGEALIPVVDVSGNITVDSAFAGEMISRDANTMVIRLFEHTKMQTHDAVVAIAKHTAWHPTAGYSQNLTVARNKINAGCKASLLSRANHDPGACSILPKFNKDINTLVHIDRCASQYHTSPFIQ